MFFWPFYSSKKQRKYFLLFLQQIIFFLILCDIKSVCVCLCVCVGGGVPRVICPWYTLTGHLIRFI